MIDAAKARELVEEAKERRAKEFAVIIRERKILECIAARASNGYHNFSFILEDKYITVATEYFNKYGFAVSKKSNKPYSNKCEFEISW